MLAQQILDKHATYVVPRNCTYYNTKEKKWCIKAKWKSEDFLYNPFDYNKDIVLWIPPPDWLVIEFEGSREQNIKWIMETRDNCVKQGLDHCIGDHLGKSPYLWIANIQGLKTNQERKALAKLLIPTDSKLDYTNLASTLVPVINHRHWKHNHIHNMLCGKAPLYHVNYLPADAVVKEPATIQQPSLCDVSDTEIDKILETDFLVQRLVNGNIIGYQSPSEARMALLTCLVGYCLSDRQIYSVMNISTGLHWHEKPHLHQYEIDKARQSCRSTRKIYGGKTK